MASVMCRVSPQAGNGELTWISSLKESDKSQHLTLEPTNISFIFVQKTQVNYSIITALEYLPFI